MSEQNRPAEAIESRIERLEREGRLWKRIGTASLLFLACLGLMGQAKQRRRTAPAPAAAAPAAAPAAAEPAGPKNIEAQSFILKDMNGRVRADLSLAGTGPSLKFRDESGSSLVTLSLNDSVPGGPMLLLSDPQRKASFSLSVLDGAGSQVAMVGGRPDIQLRLVAAADGTTLELTDKDGFSTSIGTGVQAAKNGKVKKTSAASIALFGKDRKVLWSTP